MGLWFAMKLLCNLIGWPDLHVITIASTVQRERCAACAVREFGAQIFLNLNSGLLNTNMADSGSPTDNSATLTTTFSTTFDTSHSQPSSGQNLLDVTR